MAALRMRLRAEMRSRWRATIGLALLIGLAGGGVLASTAGSRRTSSAFPRMLQSFNASDILVNPDRLGENTAVTFDAIASSPYVDDAAYIDGVGLVAPGADGKPDYLTPALSIIALASVDGKTGYSIEKPKVLDGRLPDRSQADEIFVNPAFVRTFKVRPGADITLFALDFSRIDFAAFEDPNYVPPTRPVTLTVVGVGVFQSEVVIDEGFVNPQLLLTPAFYRANPERAGYWGVLVLLKRGARDVAAFRRDTEKLAGEDETFEYQTTTATTAKVRDAVRPQALALSMFALALAGTAFLLIGQALGRQVFVESQEYPALHALGLTRRQLFLLSMARPALAALAGTGIAVAIAFLVSPFMPVGPARLAEPSPGFAFDALVLVGGAVAVILTVLALAAIPAWRASGRLDATDAAVRTSAVAETLRKLSFSPPAVTGVRFALERGRGRSALPVRTTLGAAAIAVGSVAAALTFAAGLDHLVETPRLFGWDWDVAVGSDLEPQDEAKIFAADPDVTEWSRIGLGRLTLNKRNVLAVGVDPTTGYVHPTIAAGRAPRAADEIALGARTLDRLGVSIDDRISAEFGETRMSLQVVGRAVFPGLGTYPGADKTGPGDGAVVRLETFEKLSPSLGGMQTFIRLRPGSEVGAVETRLKKALAGPGGKGFADTARVRHPAEIVNFGRVRSTPIVLAGFLALLAIGSVTHALTTAVRRRRRDLALLKTIGFVRRQVRAAVAWQATTVALVAAAAGVPLGIAMGRWSWRTLAEQLGAVAETRTPAAAMLLVAAATLVASNLIAALPARSAARTRPALVLRSE